MYLLGLGMEWCVRNLLDGSGGRDSSIQKIGHSSKLS